MAGFNAHSASHDCQPPGSKKTKASPEEVATSVWLADVMETFGIDSRILRSNIKGILDLTSKVAHQHSRPAAPGTAFLVGLAAGQRASGGTTEELNQTIKHCLRPLLGEEFDNGHADNRRDGDSARSENSAQAENSAPSETRTELR